MTWPTKTDFIDGDVLSAAQVNNIGTNLNLADPTGVSAGYVLAADGSGSMGFVAPVGGGKIVQMTQGSITSNFTTTSTSYVDTGLQVTITPTSASNYIWVVLSAYGSSYNTATISASIYSLLRLNDDTAGTGRKLARLGRTIETAATYLTSYWVADFSWMGLPPDTSARTYKLQVANPSNVTTIIEASASYPAQMFAFEVQP